MHSHGDHGNEEKESLEAKTGKKVVTDLNAKKILEDKK